MTNCNMEDYYCDGQMSLFNIPRFKIDKPIRLIELFAGIGSQAMALKRIGADFETYRVVEFDKNAITSYNAIHGTDFPTMDITEVKGKGLGITDTDKYCYIMTYSFPCQDLSVAGLGKGMTKDSGTRSGLLWEVERLLNEVDCLPQVLLMENVPQVHAEKNMNDFSKWLEFLRGKGYMNYWKDLNAADFGVAQHRERCFMVSLLGNYDYKFPRPIKLDKTVKDYLEDEVEEKFYLKSEKAKILIDKLVVGGKLLDRQTDGQTDRQLNSASTIQECCDRQMQSQQERIEASANKAQVVQESVILKNMVDKAKEADVIKTDVASALLSRDYKGVNNYRFNGVIEWK